MNSPLTDLILDASVAEAMCRAEPDMLLCQTLEGLIGHGVRVWLYAGEFHDILTRATDGMPSISSPDNETTLTSHQHLEQKLPSIQWLAALGQDMASSTDMDPLAQALTRAAARVGESAAILTTVQSRLERGGPFVAIDALDFPEAPDRVDFIDLKTQQDRIRPTLEEGIHRVLHHGRYVMGSEIETLEAQLATMAGADHCVCVSSGTDALLATLMAIEIEPGDEIITSPFTFFATAETIALLGAVPVYVDIDPETFNIDAEKIEAAISPRTRAIIPVSLYGQCAEMDEINTIAHRQSLSVIEDAAQSFGATYHGRRSCALSQLACTSFFPAKPLGAYGDGGACFTQDDALAARLRQIRDHGQDRRYHHVRLGINGRLDTLQAAVLLAKLEIFEDEIASRQRAAERYRSWCSQASEKGLLALPVVRPHNTSSWAQYTIRVQDRDEVQRLLAAKGVPSAVHYPVPLYCQPALAQGSADCPQSDRAAHEVLSLPMHPYLDEVVQGKVAQALVETLSSLSSESTRYAGEKA